jgi:hypothetical protein
MAPFNGKPILCLDFDGVIHDYKKGWQDGAIYGEPTEGFFEWADRAGLIFQLVVHSSRAASPEGSEAIMKWLIEKSALAGLPHVAALMMVQGTKPPAFLTIDDRAILFNGDWNDPLYEPHDLRTFKPWMALGANI